MKIKVAQCWDDGVYTDIRLTGILRQYGAKATFNLMPGKAPEVTCPSKWSTITDASVGYKGFCSGRIAIADYKKIYSGFKVASHNWMHEVAGKVPDDVFIEAAIHARKFLEDLFEMECPGFAWPCGGTTPETAKLLREAGFAYGRTTQYAEDVRKCADTLTLNSNCHFQDRNFMTRYNQAKEQGGVFYFWGHSYEMLDCEGLWDQLEQKIRYISSDPDAEWCDVIDLVPLCHA